jgi:hypothetical protein
MILRRATGAVSTVLLLLLSVALAEAALLVLLLVFSSILRLQLSFDLAGQLLQFWTPPRSLPYVPMPTVILSQGGVIVSVLFTFTCGTGAAAWRFRRWRPA